MMLSVKAKSDRIEYAYRSMLVITSYDKTENCVFPFLATCYNFTNSGVRT